MVCTLLAFAEPRTKLTWIAATLDRCEVPFFGPLASSILDNE